MNLSAKRLNDAMVWFWKLLSSRNTGIVLLITISLLLLIGAALPNPSLMPRVEAIKLKFESPLLYQLGENFNSIKLGKSYIFAFIGLLLITSTTFCSVDRVLKRMSTRKSAISNQPSFRKSKSLSLPKNAPGVAENISSLIQAKSWKTTDWTDNEKRIILARRGDVGFWGSIFFHAILISLLIGIVVYHVSAFYGAVRISEGQTIKLTKDSLTSISRMPVFGIKLPPLAFTFNTFSAQYDDQTATDFTADFNIADLENDRQWKEIIKINRPFTYSGIDFLMTVQGYSPNFVLYKNGTPVVDTVVALDFDQDLRDTFDIDDHGLHVVAQFFPDMERNSEGRVSTKSRIPNNPYFGIEVYQQGRQVLRKLIGKGEGGSFGPYTLEFHDLHHWIRLNLVKETGIGFFFLCAMIGLVGLVIRIVDPEEQMMASIENADEGCRVDFYHSARHFEGLLEETVDEIITSLRKSANPQ
ncbi:MAG: cytochrome c biogenesis protein ResB [Nitrospiraceae bacterium]|nr:MAG: cytochrome c biogenesis protein ResB [Nitrospiraceae bacterium]